MLSFFLDASALAKRYAPEVGTPSINHLFSKVALNRFSVFNVGLAEVVSLLVRKKNAGLLSIAFFSQALVELEKEIAQSAVNKLVADNSIVFSAIPFIQVYSINATDSLILRLALDQASHIRVAGDDLILVASDQRLIQAAQAEGLATFNPEIQTQVDLDALLAP